MTEFSTFAILIYVVGVYAQNTHKIENGIILPFIISTVSYWWAKTRFIATPIKRDAMVIIHLVRKATFAEFLLVIFFCFKFYIVIQTIIFEVERSCYSK